MSTGNTQNGKVASALTRALWPYHSPSRASRNQSAGAALASLFALWSVSFAVSAQAPDPLQAPLPAAVTTAHKLFLGNAGDQENADCLRAYNDFYAGLAKLGRFELVPDPNQADLVLELHYDIDLGQAIASNDSHHTVRQFRVVLVDPHARVALWSLTERTNYAVLQKNRNSNLDETVGKLVQDFSDLTQSQPPNNKSRVTHGFPIH